MKGFGVEIVAPWQLVGMLGEELMQDKATGHRASRAPCTTNTTSTLWKSGGGRHVVGKGMVVGDVHSTLLELRTQLIKLQEKVEMLLQYEAEKGVLEMGLGLEMRGTRRFIQHGQLKGGNVSLGSISIEPCSVLPIR